MKHRDLKKLHAEVIHSASVSSEKSSAEMPALEMPLEDWHQWRHGQGHPPWVHANWHDRRRFFFLRIIGVFMTLLVIIGGMSALAFHLISFWHGDSPTGRFVGFGGRGLFLFLPFLFLWVGTRLFRSFAVPLADIMAAADAVAGGDLNVRVAARGTRDFRRLAQSFNRMTEELARTDEQRRNLTADVAHELRTPLHIIQGNLEGILDGVYQPTTEHIEATLEETRLLARLVDDLRTLSLVESGQLPLRREVVDVNDLLADVSTSFSGQAEAAEIKLQVANGELTAASPPPLLVNGDPGRLDQVLSNLVNNAIRHTPRCGTITLNATAVDNRVRIVVADTGDGIAPEDLPFIFDRFWRADRARTHSSGVGSGLGLAITRQLIKAHNGEISVTSELGSGTTFTIELPTSGVANA
ncbi:MAG: HAMP domain-containing sensor histidine kinase [Chloroflexi bacterium]|nr:HAMP domain-containing sensor histidine kinase [Chloroflexota bacterium]